MILVGTYQYGWVALSILVASLVAYAALLLAARVSAIERPARRAWLVYGSVAMGLGVWSANCIGMLSFSLPLLILYDWPTVLLSLAAAIFGSAVALWVASRRSMSVTDAALGSLPMGGGFAAMHFMGMAAMRMPATRTWSWPMSVLSVVLAVAASGIVMWIAFHLRGEGSRQTWRRPVSAIVIGLSTSAIHYCGMAAADYSPASWPGNLGHTLSISSLGIGVFAFTALLIAATTIALAMCDRWIAAQSLKLKQSERRYRGLLESAEIILWQMDIDTRKFALVTGQTEEILFIPAEEWLSQEGFWENHIHPDDRATADGEFAEAISSFATQTFEHRMRGADGHYKWFRTSVRLSDTGLLSGVMLDVTARVMIEEALHKERSLFDAMMDTAPEYIFVYFKDLDSRFLRVNLSLAQRLGSSPLRMVGLSDADFFSPDYVSKARAVEIEIIRTGEPVLDIEEEDRWPDGRRRCMTTSKLPLRNIDGEIIGTFGFSRDITERKAAEEELQERSQQLAMANGELRRQIEERQLLESQLLQAQKLEAIGQLAAGVAHEINTPIQYVGDNCHFLDESFRQLKDVLHEYDKALGALRESKLNPELIAEVDESVTRADLAYLLEEIPVAIRQSLEGVGRVARIVRAMKEFSHPGTGHKEATDLNHAIDNTLIVCRNEWKYVADASADLDRTLPPVYCLPGEMNQVVLNLVVNGAHAIAAAKKGSGKGKIVVSTKHDGEYVEIRVSDDGIGIPAAIQPRIFDPFFTTKEVGKGTGQGLTMARNIIVKKHSGTLTFETAEQVGTTFIIRIPIGGLRPEAEGAGEAEAPWLLESVRR